MSLRRSFAKEHHLFPLEIAIFKCALEFKHVFVCAVYVPSDFKTSILGGLVEAQNVRKGPP